MTNVTIRRAVVGDIAQMTDVIWASKASNGYDVAFMAACRQELRVTAGDLANGHHWLAVNSDQILGTICLRALTATDGQIDGLFIAPNGQGRGIGRALWMHAAASARKLGLTRIQLDADPRAVPFYTAMGFSQIGEHPSGSIPGRMLPVMEIQI